MSKRIEAANTNTERATRIAEAQQKATAALFALGGILLRRARIQFIMNGASIVSSAQRPDIALQDDVHLIIAFGDMRQPSYVDIQAWVTHSAGDNPQHYNGGAQMVISSCIINPQGGKTYRMPQMWLALNAQTIAANVIANNSDIFG